MRPLSDTVVSFDKPFGGPAAGSAVPSIRSTTTSLNHDVLGELWYMVWSGAWGFPRLPYVLFSTRTGKPENFGQQRGKACMYLQYACVGLCAMQAGWWVHVMTAGAGTV